MVFQLEIRAFKLNSKDAAILDSLGWVNFRLGNLEEALKWLKQAFETNNDPEIAAHLGEVLWILGKTTEATVIWQKALKKDPEHQVLVSITTRYLK